MISPAKILNLLISFIVSVIITSAQDTDNLSLFQNPVQLNPASTGSEGPGKLRLVYRDYYPGRNLNMYSLSATYDSFFEQVHGGMGLFISENYLGGLINDLRAGASYSYHLQASRELFINAGFMASIINRSINTGNIILPDQIDPLTGITGPSAEVLKGGNHTSFDAGIGFLLSYKKYHTGFSVSHLFRPYLSKSYLEESRLDRRITIHGGATFTVSNSGIDVNPGFIFNIQGNIIQTGAGLNIGYNGLSISVLPYFTARSGLSYIQLGTRFETERFELGYHYSFLPVATQSLQPFTISNQIYISISLNNVEKRDLIKAIIYPKL